MKKIGLLLLTCVVLGACKQNNPEGNTVSTGDIQNTATADGSTHGDLPAMKFEEERHDFGRITQGEKVSYAFVFRNTGNANLIISSASGSCGCTVPSYPKEPIGPGKEGKIDVVFSSEGKSGMVEKTVTLVTNCEPSTKVLTIATEIIVPKTLENK